MTDYRGLWAWQAADRLAHMAFDLAEQRWRPQEGPVYDQLRRAALSVPLNIAEGHAFGPSKRCRSHLRIAYGSAVETEAILRFLGARTVPVELHQALASDVRALTFRLWQRSRSG